MGADKCALVTLSAGVGIPLGNHNRNAALLVSRSALLECTVGVVHKYRNGERIAVHKTYRLHNIVNHLDKLSGTLFLYRSGVVLCISPVGGNVNLNIGSSACVDCLLVHLDDFFTLLHKLLGLFLHIADSLCLGENLGK